MANKTANIFARVEPSVKEQAEEVLSELGIPMSNAVSMFLKQIALQRGIPFEMKLPANAPICIETLTAIELDEELQKGFDDIDAGHCYTMEEVKAEFKKEYGI